MRRTTVLVLAVAVSGSSACRRRETPGPSSHTESSARTPIPSVFELPTPGLPPPGLRNDENLKRLFVAFEECGRHRQPRLDGHWMNTATGSEASPSKDVWICEGRMRWRDESGLVSEICFSKVSTVEGGIDAEGVWHEDLHDPGDASGVYLTIRERAGRLSIELADWQEPNNRGLIFVLERKRDPAARPGMRCPLE